MTQNNSSFRTDDNLKASNNWLSNNTLFNEDSANLHQELNNTSQNYTLQSNIFPSNTFEKDSNSNNLYNPSKAFFICKFFLSKETEIISKACFYQFYCKIIFIFTFNLYK